MLGVLIQELIQSTRHTYGGGSVIITTLQTGKLRLREVTGSTQGQGPPGWLVAQAGDLPGAWVLSTRLWAAALGLLTYPSVEKDPEREPPLPWSRYTLQLWSNGKMGFHSPGSYKFLYLPSVNTPNVKKRSPDGSANEIFHGSLCANYIQHKTK